MKTAQQILDEYHKQFLELDENFKPLSEFIQEALYEANWEGIEWHRNLMKSQFPEVFDE